MENLPVEVIKEVKAVLELAKPAVKPIVDCIIRLGNRHRESDDDDLKDCIKDAILMLTRETQAQKRFHLEKFVENTLLTPECELEPATIFCFLQDIEQMTWRQLCLLEGFRRKDRSSEDQIKISSYSDSSINEFSIDTEIKKLIELNYLERGSTALRDYLSTSFEHIRISGLGREFSKLLDLESIDLRKIGNAFGDRTVTGPPQKY